ncbi:O-antigen ligase family protein [Luteitalea sp.]|uniref:O-antigen ligase family protein n=1 Tax=Luteitalea sp. TaxID=2004800 RepID=UPI0037CB71CD
MNDPAACAAPEAARRGGRFVPELAARAGLLLVLLGLLAAPVWATVASPLVPTWCRAALLASALIAVVRPGWSPALLVALVPLLPVWPALVPGTPEGIEHLLVASQAVPWVVRRLVAGRSGDGSTLPAGWSVLLAVATASAIALLVPEPWRGFDVERVARDLRAQVPAYIFQPDLAGEIGPIPAWTVLADGLLCALIVGWATTRATRHRVLAAAGVAAVLTALFGVYQARTGVGLQQAWRVFDAGIIRINATYNDPNALAAFYALVAPVLGGLALAASGVRRAAWAGAFGLTVAATIMTAGRTGLIALAGGVLVAVAIAGRLDLDAVDPSRVVRGHARRLVRRGVLGLAALLVVLVVAGTGLDVRHEQQTSYLHTWLFTFNLHQPPDAIAKGRLAVWTIARAMVRAHPVAGIGLGRSTIEFEAVRADLGIDTLPQDAKLSPHNTYLLVASELGALGLAAFLLMLAAVVIGARAAGNLTARDRASWPVVGLIGGLAAYGLTMLTGDRIVLREDVVVFTICASVATLGAPALPRAWRMLAVALVVVAFASVPVRTRWVGPTLTTPALPANEGFHADQVGARGESYRWSTGESTVYVPAGAHRIRIPVRNLSSALQRVEVAIDGRPADLVQLTPGPWVTLDYRLLADPGRPWHRVRLRVTPTWQAPGDARVLGVVVGDWTIDRRP